MSNPRLVVDSPTVVRTDGVHPVLPVGQHRTRARRPGQGTADIPRPRSRATPQVSVVVPTRNERDNVDDLVSRVSASLGRAGLSFEIVAVDDSDDDTPDAFRALAAQGAPVSVIHRESGDRAGGLGGALIQGFGRASGQVVVVMDADLQHPPEVLPRLVAPVLDGRAEIVVGTRYRHSGSSGGLDGPVREFASVAARSIVHALIPAARGVSDPCGGLFAVQATLLHQVVLRPEGFKILLEVLARAPWQRLVEVPFRFEPRMHGRSNFTAREVVRFLHHLLRLVLLPGTTRRLHNGLPAPRALLSRATVASERTPVGSRLLDAVRHASGARQVTWALLAVFLVGQIVHICRLENGPFLDEGIYITAGLRTLEGHGIDDGYLGWLAGSLLWPVMSGAAFSAGGLVGSRILAALFVTAAAACAARATRTLFGDRAAAWGTAAFLVAAPTLQLAHLAVYDVVAAAGLGATLMCLAEWRHRGGRGWLIGAAVFYAFAILGKYAAAFMMVPVVLGLIVVKGRRGVMGALTLFLLVASGILIAFFLPWRYQLAYFLEWRVGNNPSFGVTTEMVVYEQLQYIAPFAALAAVGVVLAGRGRRRTAALLAAALLTFPAYHILTGNLVSAVKHLVFGLVLSFPVLGLALDRLAGRRWRIVPVAAAVALALVSTVPQVQRLDRGWLDATEGGRFLAANVRPGDTLLIPNAWQVLPFIYGDAVQDLALVTDAYGFAHAPTTFELCDQDWVVNSVNDNGWSEVFMRRLFECGNFVEVMSTRGEITNLAPELEYVTYQADFVVYRNVGGSR